MIPLLFSKTPRDLAEHFGVWLKRGVKRLASRFHTLGFATRSFRIVAFGLAARSQLSGSQCCGSQLSTCAAPERAIRSSRARVGFALAALGPVALAFEVRECMEVS